jgi:hypothetical protein
MGYRARSLKRICAACGNADRAITQEHFWPRWLIRRCNAENSMVRWIGGRRVPPLKATVPLCKSCNSILGKNLEEPVSKIFQNLEAGDGLSDYDCELLVRWLWKFEGLAWILNHPGQMYTPIRTLQERIVEGVAQIRGSLVLALSRISVIDSASSDRPMGIDSLNESNAIFVAGVFLFTAIMVLLDLFIEKVPTVFDIYRLHPNPLAKDRGAKLFYPRVGFRDDIEAINVTASLAKRLSKMHDDWVIDLTAGQTQKK